MNYIFRNCAIYMDNDFYQSTIIVYKNIIKDIILGNEKVSIKNYTIIECKGLIVIPAFVDMHLHSRLDGINEDVETKLTFKNACFKSGINYGVCMANTKKVINDPIDVKRCKKIFNSIELDNIWQAASATRNLAGKKINNFDSLLKNTVFFSDDGCPILDKNIMKNILDRIENKHCRLLVHDSLPSNVIEKIKEAKVNSKNNSFEAWIVNRDLKLIKKRNCMVHFQHVACPRSAKMIYKMKKKNKNITSEITPHHLMFFEEDIDYKDGRHKMNPPLTSRKNAAKLLNYFNKGYFDAIATDHAPHYEKHKKVTYDDAKNGVAGIETLFSSLYTYLVRTKRVRLNKIVEHTSIKPARIFFNKDVSLKKDNKATFLIYDLNEKFTLNKNTIVGGGKNYILDGAELYGKLKYYIKDGKVVYADKWENLTEK